MARIAAVVLLLAVAGCAVSTEQKMKGVGSGRDDMKSSPCAGCDFKPFPARHAV